MRRVAGLGRGVAFEVIEAVGRPIAVVPDELGIFFLLQVMQTPVLTVQKNHARAGGLGFRAGLGREALHQLIAHECHPLVMAGRPKQEVLELGPRAVGKDAVAERLPSSSARAVEVEPLDREALRRVAVDLARRHPAQRRRRCSVSRNSTCTGRSHSGPRWE